MTSFLIVGNVPPPWTGASVVTGEVLAELNEIGAPTHVVDIVPDSEAGGKVVAEASSFVQLIRAIWSSDADVVYCQGMDGRRLWIVLFAAMLCRFKGLPVYFHHHSFRLVAGASSRRRALFSRFLRVRHIALTAGMMERLQVEYPRASIFACSNAAAIRPLFGADGGGSRNSDCLKLAFVGKAGLSKGEDFAVEIAEKIAQSRTVELSMAGADFDEGSHRTRSGAEVKKLGVLDEAELANLYRSSDVLVFPSRYAAEAAPLAIYEAIACGLPVVASNRGFIPDLQDELEGLAVLDNFELDNWAAAVVDSATTATARLRHRSTYREMAERIEADLAGTRPRISERTGQ